MVYVHVCEQAHWACPAGNSAKENLSRSISIIIMYTVMGLTCKCTHGMLLVLPGRKRREPPLPTARRPTATCRTGMSRHRAKPSQKPRSTSEQMLEEGEDIELSLIHI